MDEWTSADTGVGAAIAAGNHLEKGIWALLVIAAVIIKSEIIREKEESHIFIINQCPWFKVSPIANKRSASPMRLVKAVIIPAASDFGFW